MKRNRRAWIRAVMLLATVTTSLRAATPVGSATIELAPVPSWSNCPSERQLAAMIDAELQGMGRDDRSARAAVRVRISRSGGQFVAQVQVDGQPDGQRQLEAPQCESLGDALAVAIAVTLDGQAARAVDASDAAAAATSQHQQDESSSNIQPAATKGDKEKSAPPPLQPLAIQHTRIPPTTIETEPPFRRGGWGLWLGGGLGSDASMLATAGGELDWHPFEARLGAWWQSLPNVDLAPGTVARSRLGGMTVGCLGWGRQLKLLACGHAWLGAESFEGRGFDQPRSDRVFWGAAGPGLGLETGQRLRIALDAVALASFTSDSYVARAAKTEQKGDLFALWLLLRVGLSITMGPLLPRAQ